MFGWLRHTFKVQDVTQSEKRTQRPSLFEAMFYTSSFKGFTPKYYFLCLTYYLNTCAQIRITYSQQHGMLCSQTTEVLRGWKCRQCNKTVSILFFVTEL